MGETDQHGGIRGWFTQPPRRHGEILEDRSVSPLELFYDLVFVVFVSEIAHTLATHVSAREILDFVVLFGLVWVAWFNGTQFHELHGREDGRGRSFIFLQMGIIAVVAVYAPHAADGDGEGFAWAYAMLLALQAYQWWSVLRIDEERYRTVAVRYLAAMCAGIALVVVSALVADEDLRLVLWAAVVAGAIGLGLAQGLRTQLSDLGLVVTESMVERFGLFVIIVLGEVVVGVVSGMSEATRDVRTIATGVLCLGIGFGFWWTYFDFVGDRLPRASPGAVSAWMFSHLPTTLTIAGAGAGMASLVEHAHDGRTPTASSWLIASAVAGLLLSQLTAMRSLADHERLAHVYRPLTPALLAAAGAALVLGALHPAPWLLALGLVTLLSATWWIAFLRLLGGASSGAG
jgi:low temperature requirement protein LtrA